MELFERIRRLQEPILYESGDAFMWTDPHIAKQLLGVHLSNQTDLASRKMETIHTTVNWILSQVGNTSLKVLDLGCGPGLYSEQFAAKGHAVTGVDISDNSIAYAQDQARIKRLDIEYICKDYTSLDLPDNHFDLVILVYTDICPLVPVQREKLLKMIKKTLKPGGTFVFDFTNDKNIHKMLSPNNWELTEQGFWKNKPYLALSSSFLYEEQKVVLFQHAITDEEGETDLYRFWHHFFSEEDVREFLNEAGFVNIDFYANVIPAGEGYESEDITFCVVRNSI